MSVSNYVHSMPTSVTIDESTDHPKVRFHEEGMRQESAEIMYEDHERNVFVLTHDSELPYDIHCFDGSQYEATSLHVVFLQYIDNGTFEIISSSFKFNVRILLEAFRAWGFKHAEYRPCTYSHYIQCNEKEAMLLKLKTGL